MTPKTHKEVRQAMSPFLRQGAHAYRKKQFQRLCAMLNEIFDHEPQCQGELTRLGKRQIIGYWKRTPDSNRVKIEKYQVLKQLFSQLGKNEPPKPKNT